MLCTLLSLLVLACHGSLTNPVDEGHIVILGATSGFGRLLAVRLAREYRARLVLFGRRSEQGQEVERECLEAGARSAHFVTGDVALEQDISRAFNAAVPGHVSAVFVNAGYFPHPTSYVDEPTLKTVDTIIGTNIRGPILATRAAVRAMREHGGTLVYTSSVGGSLGNGGSAAFGKGSAIDLYTASKSFMDGLARATYSWKDSIRVFTLSPSCYATEMAEGDGCAQVVNPVLRGVTGDANDVVQVMISLIDGTTIYGPGTNIGIEGPFTYNAAARYRLLYERSAEMTANFPIPLSEFRDLSGRHLEPPLTQARVDEMIRAYQQRAPERDEL